VGLNCTSTERLAPVVFAFSVKVTVASPLPYVLELEHQSADAGGITTHQPSVKVLTFTFNCPPASATAAEDAAVTVKGEAFGFGGSVCLVQAKKNDATKTNKEILYNHFMGNHLI